MTRTTNRRTLVTLALLAIGVALPHASFGQSITWERWEAHASVEGSSSRQRLSFGVRKGATDARDILYDVPALFGRGIRAYLALPGVAGSYFRDVRGPTYPMSFDLVVEPSSKDPQVTLAFNLRYLPDGCERVDLALVDPETGAIADLRRTPRVTVETDGRRRRFQVRAVLSEAPSTGRPEVSRALLAGRSGRLSVEWVEPTEGAPVAGYQVFYLGASGDPVPLSDSLIQGDTYLGTGLGELEASGSIFVRPYDANLCAGPDSRPVPVSPGQRR